jgi:DNA-directed RNA polymerase subunit RPC12/RpoP
MAIGAYPFRCLDCNARFPVNVLLLSRLAYAKCPKCLGLELTTWATKRYHISLIRTLMLTLGARRYRCAKCRCNFVSFRPKAARAQRAPAAQEEIAAAEDPVVHDEAEIHPEII